MVILLGLVPGLATCDDVPTPPDYDECSPGWMRVAAGPFEMGMNEDDPSPVVNLWGSDLAPRHRVMLSEFCIMKTEVPVSSYRACVDAGACAVPDATTTEDPWCNFSAQSGNREEHPVNCIAWADARNFCQVWEGGDLPSEAQWEKAARGADGRYFPWGNELPDCSRANYDVDGPVYDSTGGRFGCLETDPIVTWPVGYLRGIRGDSPYGVKDMAGNVGEWLLDCYEPLRYQECSDGTCIDPVYPCNSTVKAWRGGAATNPYQSSLSSVGRGSGSESGFGTGFRCTKRSDH